MSKETKLIAVINAISTIIKNEDKIIFSIAKGCPQELNSLISDIVWKMPDVGERNLAYEIISKACDIIAEFDTIEGLKTLDAFDWSQESASVYNSERLSYLNIHNYNEISEKMKEFNTDILSACAVWYDEKVAEVVDKLKNYILQ